MSTAPNVKDEYVEKEPVYSCSEKIEKVSEWKRRNTYSAISANQLGLIPYWMDNYSYQKTDTYFMRDKYEINRAWYTTVFYVEGIMNNIMLDEEQNDKYYDLDDNRMRYYKMNMIDAYKNGRCNAFMVFVNGCFVPWSNLSIIRNSKMYFLMIENMDKDILVDSFEILHIPFKVEYDEEYNESTIRNMFSFDENGKFTLGVAKYHVGIGKDTVFSSVFSSPEFAQFDTAISPEVHTTPENYFIFTNEGLLTRSAEIEVFNRNLITTSKGNTLNEFVVAVWDERSNKNESMAMRAINNDFSKRLMNGLEGIANLDTHGFENRFDFAHYPEEKYAANLARSENYIFHLDHNKFDKVFMDTRNVNIVEYGYIKPTDGKITMARDEYEGHNYETFCIIFIDGIADSDCNNSIIYTADKFTFNIRDEYTNLVIVYFRKVMNTLYDAPIKDKSIDLEHSVFPDINCITPMVDLKSDGILRPLMYSIDGTNILLDNEDYYAKKLYLISKYQFHHKLFLNVTGNVITLGEEFRTAYDKEKFLIFVDGHLLNRIYYEAILPSMFRQDDVTKRAIYLRCGVPSTAKVDVYYVSSAPLNELTTNGDLLIACIKTKAFKKGQLTFKVPYPFRNYPHIYDAFFCIRDSMYVDKSRYVFDGDNITFTDSSDGFNFAEDLIFVFPYYKPDWDNDGEVSADSAMKFHYYRYKTTRSTNKITFTNDSRGVPNGATYLFIDTTYINQLRYTLDGSTITFKDETIKPNTVVTLVVETDEEQFIDNNVVLDSVLVTATEDRQYVFDIPEVNYYDSFFIIKGSVILAPNRYFVTTDNKILMTDEDDYIPRGRNLHFVFVRKKNDIPENYTKKGLIHLKTDYMMYRPTEKCKSFKIPTNFFHRFRFNENNVIMWANSVFYDTDRYTITDNVITLTNSDDYFYPSSLIVLMIGYETLSYNAIDGDLEEKDIIYFEDVDVAMRNGSSRYVIPWPNPPFTDTAFMVSIGGRFVPEDDYTVNGNIISFKDTPERFVYGHKIRFTFIHNKGFTYISKCERSVTLKANQEEVDIPSPFNKIVNLNRRMIVTYGGAYLDKERYLVDNVNRKLLFISASPKAGRDLHFYFFYTGSRNNGAIAFLPESGYFYLKNKALDRNVNKDLMMVFLNGKLVPKSAILDITNNLHKVKANVGSRYDFTVLGCSPAISEFKSEYESGLDTWSTFIDQFPIVQK